MGHKTFLMGKVKELYLSIRYASIRQEWLNGTRTPLTHTIEEWEYLGKPNKKQTNLKA
tara:strand:- start:1189 stop:1362 length:174 start_codon:yes stop_codon:yes gene_type:complete